MEKNSKKKIVFLEKIPFIEWSLYIYIYIQKGIRPLRDFYLLKNYLFRSYIRVCFQLVVFVREHMWRKAIWMGQPMRLKLIRVGLLVECF